MDDIRYPIGKFQPVDPITREQRDEWIAQVAAGPTALKSAIAGSTPEQLDSPYREGGWTVKQIAAHLAENDMLVYSRFKHALTEDNPPIHRAEEAKWAELPDKTVPIESSVELFRLVRERWVTLMKGMSDADFERTFQHPLQGAVPLQRTLGLYAWHGRHHIAQIEAYKENL